jgi:DNA-binding NarL/FixJ family response regulator
VIADDHAIVRDGLRALIDGQPGLQVVGEASDGQEAIRLAGTLQPDVLVLDLSMPSLGGAEAADRLAVEHPNVKVIALTMHEERGYVTRFLRSGAAGYVLKRTASVELVRAIRAAASGEQYVDPSIGGSLLTGRPSRRGDGAPRPTIGDGEAAPLPHLTPRESEVLHLLALGHSNKEIAAALSISVKTVETHRATGMAKLGLSNRAALVRYAITEGWLRSE